MAINLDVQDLDNYPGTVKRVTLDMESIVPTGTNGDEKNMLTSTTSAYSDIENRTSIQGLYVMGGKVGWSKSSGFKGSAGKFQLTAGANKLGINMDSTVSGTYTHEAKSYYEIALDYDATPRSGSDIAVDMQSKIRNIMCTTGDTGYQLAYKNSDVEYLDGKFYISSGTIANSYTGSLKTSVHVAPAASEDCSVVLGFDQQTTSENLSGITSTEAPLTSDYVGGTTPISIGLNTGIQAGDSFYITDDGITGEYCPVLAVSGGDITVPINATNSFDGISNSYTTGDGAYIQILRPQDPEGEPGSFCKDIDELTRFMAKSMINQIDFSG